MDTFDILKNGLANIPGIDNDWDRFLYHKGINGKRVLVLGQVSIVGNIVNVLYG